ncbi:type VI immunity family protein [Corallococcus sp. bb12-1]|uniref:type VI immunity family protein n=1 Tax=Corallococcus sp. bb12-1 TaxID=2996784 RepID=UPI00226FA860|nr:type VI immunity family protein [Corallococcus sp. bb12-1]
MLQEGICISFYMHRSHQEMGHSVLRALDVYLEAVGRDVLRWYPDTEGDWQELTAEAWAVQRTALREASAPRLQLTDRPSGVADHEFNYQGQDQGALSEEDAARAVCAISCWLPTAFLERQGPARVQRLASELATVLPFDSGHAGLAFHALSQLSGVRERLEQERILYPGMDVPDEDASRYLGTRVRGIHWMNFLGPPVLGELGGAEALRARLTHPGTAVQPLGEDRTVVILGDAPDAGDTSQGSVLPAYRELARVLEPWLTSREAARPFRENGALRRWERRFLD